MVFNRASSINSFDVFVCLETYSFFMHLVPTRVFMHSTVVQKSHWLVLSRDLELGLYCRNVIEPKNCYIYKFCPWIIFQKWPMIKHFFACRKLSFFIGDWVIRIWNLTTPYCRKVRITIRRSMSIWVYRVSTLSWSLSCFICLAIFD